MARKKAGKLLFKFRNTPWKDVLDWFAEQADLSLVIPESAPSGTFNYSDTHEYTPAEAIDLLNRVLQTKGFILVRSERMLMVINTEDPLPPNLVSTVPLESLDAKGESELVNVHFKLTNIRPEDIETEVKKLLGPPGSIVALAKSQELSVTDTAGRLRVVRDYLKSIDVLSGLKTFHVQYVKADDLLPILRQLLEIPEDKNAAADGSIRVVQEAGGNRLLVSGRPDKVARASGIIEALDVPTPGGPATGPRGHVRTVPMSEDSARAALRRVEEVWPSMRPNKIRVVSPPSGGGSTPATDDGAESPRELPGQPRGARPAAEARRTLPLLDQRPADLPRAPAEKPRQKHQEGPKPPVQRVTMATQQRSGKVFGARIFCVADPPVAPAPAKVPEGKSPAPIFVIPGPNGLTITSDDLEALDELERLLATSIDKADVGPMKVFFLKYAKAQDVAEELEKFLAGGASGSEGSSASGRKGLTTGPVKITPEPRLNALMVLANRADQDTVEQLLKKIFDLKESPEDVEVAPKPRMIAIAHARAKDIADVLRQVYADRLVVAQDQQQGRRGGFLPMLMGGMMAGRGGGGPGGDAAGGFGGGGRGQTQTNQANRIAVGVDNRTNNLVVTATDPMFEEVKELVEKLDLAAAEENETVRVVTLHRTSASAVEKALAAFAGDAVQANTSTSTTAQNANNNGNPSMPPWFANRNSMNGGAPGGQPAMGGGGQFGGNSPFQGGYGGRGRGRFSQPGGPGQ